MKKLSQIEVPLPKLKPVTRVILFGITIVPLCVLVIEGVIYRLPQDSGGGLAPNFSFYLNALLVTIGLMATYVIFRWLRAVYRLFVAKN